MIHHELRISIPQSFKPHLRSCFPPPLNTLDRNLGSSRHALPVRLSGTFFCPRPTPLCTIHSYHRRRVYTYVIKFEKIRNPNCEMRAGSGWRNLRRRSFPLLPLASTRQKSTHFTDYHSPGQAIRQIRTTNQSRWNNCFRQQTILCYLYCLF